MAHHPTTRGLIDRILGRLPEWYAGRVAARMEPMFTTTGADAIRDILARLPK